MEEYANRTSIHGIGYIFAHDLGLFERLLWMIVVLGFLAAALLLSANLWIQWEEQQVVIFWSCCVDGTTIGSFVKSSILLQTPFCIALHPRKYL